MKENIKVGRRRWSKDQPDSLEAAEMAKPTSKPRHEMSGRSGLHLVGIVVMIIVVGRMLQMIFAASLGISSSISNDGGNFPVSDQLDPESIKAFVRHELFHLGVFTTVWRRPEITTVVLEYYRGLRIALQESGIILHLFAVGSQGAESRQICERSGFAYLEHPNQPLGRKHNAGLMAMHRAYPHLDAVLIIGSDDIVDRKYLELCRDTFKYYTMPLFPSFMKNQRYYSGMPQSLKKLQRVQNIKLPVRDSHLRQFSRYLFIGAVDSYFLDLNEMKLKYEPGYNNKTTRADKTMPGRCIHAEALNSVGWAPWADDFVKNLDGSMYQSMSKTSLGFAERSLQVNARANGFVQISLKGGPSNNSIHSWKQIIDATNVTSGDLQVLQPMEDAHFSVIAKAFPEPLVDGLIQAHVALSHPDSTHDDQLRASEATSRRLGKEIADSISIESDELDHSVQPTVKPHAHHRHAESIFNSSISYQNWCCEHICVNS